jgi:hypothetical protein
MPALAPAAVRAAVAAALRSERIAVGLALAVAALAESALARAVRAAALSVPERLAVTAAVAGGGAVHRELGNRPRGRVALDARQRRANQAPVQADLRMRRRGRWRLLSGSLRGGRLARRRRGWGLG